MALLLRKRGFRKVRPLAGGLTAWRDRGMPMAELPGEPSRPDAVPPG